MNIIKYSFILCAKNEASLRLTTPPWTAGDWTAAIFWLRQNSPSRTVQGCTVLDDGCRSYTFLKMQQLKKHQFLKSAALMRGTRIRQFVTFAARQTHRLTRQPYLVAEVIPLMKYCTNVWSVSLYPSNSCPVT